MDLRSVVFILLIVLSVLCLAYPSLSFTISGWASQMLQECIKTPAPSKPSLQPTVLLQVLRRRDTSRLQKVSAGPIEGYEPLQKESAPSVCYLCMPPRHIPAWVQRMEWFLVPYNWAQIEPIAKSSRKEDDHAE